MKNLAKRIHETNVKNGFYEDVPKNIGEMLALIHSEVSEALESDRKGRYANLQRFMEMERTINEDHISESKDDIWKGLFEKYIKDSFEDELADAIIRLLDLAQYKGIDIEKHIELKLHYNSLRPYKHGKKY